MSSNTDRRKQWLKRIKVSISEWTSECLMQVPCGKHCMRGPAPNLCTHGMVPNFQKLLMSWDDFRGSEGLQTKTSIYKESVEL